MAANEDAHEGVGRSLLDGQTHSRQRGLNRALIRSTTTAVTPVSVRVDARAGSDSNEPADVPLGTVDQGHQS